jgi:hypothetical protein
MHCWARCMLLLILNNHRGGEISREICKNLQCEYRSRRSHNSACIGKCEHRWLHCMCVNVFSLISASLMHILNLKAEQVWSVHDLK